jgi:arylsulfatase B
MTSHLRRKRLPDGSLGRWNSSDGRLYLNTMMGSGEPSYDADNPILRNGSPTTEREPLTRAFTREATAFLERSADRPFFLMVAYNAVHSPMQAENRVYDRLGAFTDPQRRVFAAMLTELDEGVGRVLSKLRLLRLERDTLVIFLSDNGGPTKELTSSNAPLSGGKGDLLEGGIRVPMFISWPTHIPKGRIEQSRVSSLDISATIFSAAGLDSRGWRLEGRDLLPILSDRATPSPQSSLYWRVGSKHAVISGDWKMIGDGAAPRLLYDLGNDPSETQDLASRQPGRLAELVADWERWDREQVAPLPMGRAVRPTGNPSDSTRGR